MYQPVSAVEESVLELPAPASAAAGLGSQFPGWFREIPPAPEYWC